MEEIDELDKVKCKPKNKLQTRRRYFNTYSS